MRAMCTSTCASIWHMCKNTTWKETMPQPDQASRRATIKHVRDWAVGKLKSKHKHWLITIRFFVYKHCVA